MSSYALSLFLGHFDAQESVSPEAKVLSRVWAWSGMEIYANRALKVNI